MDYAVKILVTALVVLAAAETARRSPSLGAVIVALPLTSMLAMWALYYDTRDTNKVAEFAYSIPLAVIPSLLFFYVFGFLVEYRLGFVMAMVLASTVMLGGYALFLYLKQHG